VALDPVVITALGKANRRRGIMTPAELRRAIGRLDPPVEPTYAQQRRLIAYYRRMGWDATSLLLSRETRHER
jgi:hypothetical protein